MLAPRFAVDVIGIAAADAVFVLAPAGVGMLAAAFVLSRTTAGPLADRRRVITGGLVLVSVALGVAAGLPALGRAVGLLGPEGQEIGVMGTAHLGLVGGIMASTLAAGVGFASIVVAAQTLMQERAPIRARGRVFAVQLTMGNLLAVIPLLSIGGLADLVGVNRVLIVLAVSVLLVAVLSRRDWEREDEPVGDSEVASPPSSPGR
ncbi:MAG: hypothetical protein GEU73_13545 [Chloroflexi bacterium]|nr:hypothetical protein [Chloroflexota bacterium]